MVGVGISFWQRTNNSSIVLQGAEDLLSATLEKYYTVGRRTASF